MKGRKTVKRIRKKKSGFDYKRFAKKGVIRLAYRFVDIIVLFIVGWSLGLKLIRY